MVIPLEMWVWIAFAKWNLPFPALHFCIFPAVSQHARPSLNLTIPGMHFHRHIHKMSMKGLEHAPLLKIVLGQKVPLEQKNRPHNAPYVKPHGETCW